MTERNPREGIREELRQKIMEQLQECSRMEDDELYEQIDRAIREKGQELFLPLKERLWLRSSLYDSFRRLDILQELLDDRNVTEIMVNGAGKIFIERKDGTALWERRFERPEQLEDIIQQIVGRVNRVVNVSSPIADARLEDGSRVHIVLPPVALDGPVVTIRKFPEPITMEKLIGFGAVTEEAAQFLEGLVAARYNIFVSGGTNSGKTTFLNALSSFIPRTERVITIEDSAELQIKNIENLVSLETRNANTSGRGKGTDYHQPVNPGFAEDESGSDHRGRGKRRRGSGYAAGYEHRPSGFSLNGPQQFSQRYAEPSGNYGFNGSQTAAGGGPKPDRFGFGYSGSSGTAGRRKQKGTFHCGGKRYIYGRNRNRGAVQI